MKLLCLTIMSLIYKKETTIKSIDFIKLNEKYEQANEVVVIINNNLKVNA